MQKLSFILLFSFHLIGFSQVAIFKHNAKFGLKDGLEIISKAKFDNIRPEKDGMYACKKGDNWGFLNNKGKLVINTQYKEIQDFSKGLAGVQSKKTSKWGFINKKGEKIVPFEYAVIQPFTSNVTLIKRQSFSSGKIINKKGEMIVDDANYFEKITENRILIGISNRGDTYYNYIDQNGNLLFNTHLKEKYYLTEQPSIVAKYYGLNPYVYTDISCDTLSDWFEEIIPFNKGLSIVKKQQDYSSSTGTWSHIYGALNEDFKLKTPMIFDDLRFSESVLLGKKKGEKSTYFIDELGKPISEGFEFKDYFKDGVAIVKDSSKAYYFINKQMEKIAGPFNKYQFFNFNDNISSVVRKNDLRTEYAYIKRNGELITDWYPEVKEHIADIPAGENKIKSAVEFFSGTTFIKSTFGKRKNISSKANIYDFDGGNFISGRAPLAIAGNQTSNQKNNKVTYSDNAKFGYIDSTGQVVIDCKFDQATDFSSFGLARVVINNSHGIIDVNGNYVISPQYEKLGKLSNTRPIRAKKNGKWGFIDEKGNEVFPFIYDEVKDFSYSKAKVRIGEKWKSIYQKQE